MCTGGGLRGILLFIHSMPCLAVVDIHHDRSGDQTRETSNATSKSKPRKCSGDRVPMHAATTSRGNGYGHMERIYVGQQRMCPTTLFL